jgi:hypothetical protein
MVWFLIFSFVFSSIPYNQVLLPSFYLSEARAAEQGEEQGQNLQEQEQAAAKEAPKAGIRAEMAGMESSGGGGGTIGISVPVTETSLFAGAATTKIPIEVPPERAGAAPSLALTYNSYQGNGWSGMGWSLDMGAIQRSTKRGINYSANDYVAAINGSSSELVRRADWDQLCSGGQGYGAAIEGSLSRYCYQGASGWEVTTKEGTKYFYGSASDGSSRQDFNGGQNVFK